MLSQCLQDMKNQKNLQILELTEIIQNYFAHSISISYGAGIYLFFSSLAHCTLINTRITNVNAPDLA